MSISNCSRFSKIFRVFLAAVLAVTMCPMPSFADEASTNYENYGTGDDVPVESETLVDDSSIVDGSSVVDDSPAELLAIQGDSSDAVNDEPSIKAQAISIPVPSGGTFEWGSDELAAWQRDQVYRYRDVYGAGPVLGDGVVVAIHAHGTQFPVFGMGALCLIGSHTVTYELADGYVWADGVTGSRTVTVNVTGGSVADCAVSGLSSSYNYTGSAIKPSIKLTANKNIDGVNMSYPLVKDVDYTVSYSNNVKAGTATVTITGIGLFSGTLVRNFKIVEKPAKSVPVPKGGTFEWGSDELAYWQETNVGIYARAFGAGYSLSANTPIAIHAHETEYPVFGMGALCLIGSHTVTYELADGYVWADGVTGSRTVTVNVTGGSVADCAVSGLSSNYGYTGSAVKPSIKLTANKNIEGFNMSYPLVKGVDYTVSYSNNVKAGTATITIKGIGNFSGTLVKSFTIGSIAKATVALSKTSYVANGTYRKPSVTVKLGGKTLVKGTDYTVSYSNNKVAGKAKVTVTGIGNYMGKVSKTFTIKAAPNGWSQSGGYWYYGVNSAYISGWRTIDGARYYFDATNNRMVTGLKLIDGKRYYFASSGAMVKSAWQKVGTSWYYLTSTGVAKTGWLTQGSAKYRFHATSGKMLTGLWKIDGKRYYFASSGAMTKSSWVKSGGYWYYMTSTGPAKSGWLTLGGKRYYFNPTTNRMVTGTQTINGVKYRFDSSGALI